MSRLRFNPIFAVRAFPPDEVFLLAEAEQHALHGALYFALAPLLAGELSRGEIIARLTPAYLPMQVDYALRRLQARGYLIETDAADTPEARFWEGLGMRPQADAAVLARDGLDPQPLAALLAADGIALSAPGSAALTLVLTDDPADPGLDACYRQFTQPWMLVRPQGLVVWVGPVFTPAHGPCPACLRWRLQSNLPLLAYLTDRMEAPVPAPTAALPTSSAVGLALAAHEAALWLAGTRRLQGSVLTWNAHTSETAMHRLLPRPNCPLCGSTAPRQAQPVRLNSRPRVLAANDSGFRSAAAADTLSQYGDLISPLIGIVPYLARVETPEHLHVFASGHNKARPLAQWRHYRRHLRNQSAGKGADELQARASALCEAIERYSGLFHGDEPRQMARWGEMDAMLHPHALMGFSARQYAEREAWNRSQPPHLAVPEPYDPQVAIAWSPAWSLTNERFAQVPTAYAYYDVPRELGAEYLLADSNGCAAGSSLEDAILQGLLELIERDAVALWWYNMARRPAFDLDAFEHPYLQRSRQFFHARNRELWVLDLTADLGIPVAVAVSRQCGAPTEDIVLGFGAHLDPSIAVLRAVSELNQILPAALQDKDGRYQSDSPWEIRWWQEVRVDSHPFLQPLPGPHSRPGAFVSSGDVRDDLHTCVSRLAARAFEVLVIDQTRADARLPVARVIVPGLRHFWARLAPGRLYDVPVSLGWIPAPLSEGQVNPLPMLL
jgi:ribosomal protein S12 methylthiotransferase accessory factor